MLSFITALDPAGTLELDLSVERLEGYEEGLGEMWDPTLVRTCRPNAAEPARKATIDLLRATDSPTAILAMSDILALGALDGAVEASVSVPGELSVVGFDDSPAAPRATPPLTTVAQPQEEKGKERGARARNRRPSSSCASPPRRRILESIGNRDWPRSGLAVWGRFRPFRD